MTSKSFRERVEEIREQRQEEREEERERIESMELDGTPYHVVRRAGIHLETVTEKTVVATDVEVEDGVVRFRDDEGDKLVVGQEALVEYERMTESDYLSQLVKEADA